MATGETELLHGSALVPYTFATWVFSLHVGGVVSVDEEVAAQCAAILHATEAAQGNAAGEALVARLRELLSDGSQQDLSAAATKLYGDRVRTDLGSGDRTERTARIRKYQFQHHLPWLARIWERTPNGVEPSWLLVERVTDQVTAADPNPWNDIDEERHLPLDDFHVLWELDLCSSLSVV